MRAAFVLLLMFCLPLRGAEEVERQGPPASVEKFFSYKIPKFACEDTTLHDLLMFLSGQMRRYDPREKPGVSLLLVGFTADRMATEKADYFAENVSVNQVFTDLAGIYRVEFHVVSRVGVVITPEGGKPFPNAKSEEGDVIYTYKAKSTKKE